MNDDVIASREPLDTTNCDDEPIHVPGSVQPFGALVSFDKNGRILRASESFAALCGCPVNFLFGKNIQEFFPKVSFAEVFEKESFYAVVDLASGEKVEVLKHCAGEEVYLDVVPYDDRHHSRSAEKRIHDFEKSLENIESIENFAERLVQIVRHHCQIDRVKLYRFDENWDGEIIAESKLDEMPSYLALRFPKSDIPQQARRLYQLNKVRVIANVDAPQSRIVDAQPMGALDLSSSFVRSVSEIHLQYLRNMEVQASMSISLFEGERFWGLLACHNRTALRFSLSDEAFYEGISQLASKKLTELNDALLDRHRQNDQKVIAEMLSSDRARTLDEKLLEGELSVLDLIPANGAAIVRGGRMQKRGIAPAETALPAILHLLEQSQAEVIAFDDLLERLGEDVAFFACGVLAIRLPERNNWLLWFRVEAIKEVAWAGDPYKPERETKFGDRLYPRTSFELWKEKSRGRSKPWTAFEKLAAQYLAEAVKA